MSAPSHRIRVHIDVLNDEGKWIRQVDHGGDFGKFPGIVDVLHGQVQGGPDGMIDITYFVVVDRSPIAPVPVPK